MSADTLPIRPFTQPVRVAFSVPGSKSITNRALILAAMCNQTLTLRGALFSRDTQILCEALKALGFSVDANAAQSTIALTGLGGKIPRASAEINVGNAGTAARFLTAFLTLHPAGTYTLDGDPAMRKRPMKGLMDALKTTGATFTFHGEPDCFPFTLHTKGWTHCTALEVDARASSQILSALLMVAGAQPHSVAVKLVGKTVSEPFVEMTLQMLTQFGATFTQPESGLTTFAGTSQLQLPSETYRIEPDATAASYFLSLPMVAGGKVILPEGEQITLQGDIDFLKPLAKTGLTVAKANGHILIEQTKESFEPVEYDFEAISDTFLTLAALSPLLSGPTRITGIGHTRHQETDRIRAMANELQKLGQMVVEEPDAIEIHPDLAELYARADASKHCGRLLCVDTYEDHRMAMSFAILGSYDLLQDGQPWLQIRDPKCCGKTFPSFFQHLEQLHSLPEMNIEFLLIAVDGGAASGKSSTSRGVAERLNLMHVDTGSHYRAITFECLKNGIAADAPEKVAAFLKTLSLDTQLVGRTASIVTGGHLPEPEALRSAEVNQHVSAFAALPCVRDAVKGYQRSQVAVAQENKYVGLIMEGRDIGSVIFPEASLKIYLQADEATRSKRREAEGQSDTIAQRDRIDSTRKTAPLQVAPNAVIIDNSTLSLQQVIDKIATLAIPLCKQA
jgi:3-phosphoshikimate 1-carboxyvinyltransferase